MKHIIYKYSATGVVGYIGCDDAQEIFSISSIVAPQAITHIHCKNVEYVSYFDITTALMPGVTTREICDKKSGQTIAKLQWDGTGSYTLSYGQDQYSVYCNANQCLVRLRGVPVLAMQAVEKGSNIPAFISQKYYGYDIETKYEIYTNDQLTNEQLAVFSAIPMLEFGC